MERHKIRTSATDSVKSTATNHYLDVSLRQTTKALPYPNVSSTLSQRTVYEEERNAGNRFRLILTVIPYCSNVLFNPLTEIIYNEGSDDVDVVTDTKKAKTISNSIGVETPDRIQMIQNTEYSSSKHGGYEYHPGYDFFDNHILRNQSFKIVNPFTSKGATDAKNVFNTLSDYSRDRFATGIHTMSARFSTPLEITNNIKKHLYLHDDILSIDESINQNLYEENGWWGFVNNTTIDAKELNTKTYKWNTMDISRVLNNHKSCEFIDMYPDRSLYSFAPKFNSFTHENEYNWNIVLTYPYKNFYDHPLCLGGSSYVKKSTNENGDTVEETVSEGNRWMGLKVMNVELASSNSGSTSLLFRTYTKHGLEKGEMFYIYYTNPYKKEDDENYLDSEKFGANTLNGKEIYYESNSYYKVSNVGDLSKSNSDYLFYVSDVSILEEIYKSFIEYARKIEDEENEWKSLYKNDDKKGIYNDYGELKTNILNPLLRFSNFRIRRCVSGVKSTYYIRQFRKLPNLCSAEREMTDEEKLHKSKFNGVFDEYIADNALDPINPNVQRNFKAEIYQLAFASNIYNDNVAQFTFTDSVNTKNLTDNLGRPLSEIYYTVIKNNSGHETWYNSESPLYSNSSIKKEYSNKQNDFKSKYGVDYNGYKVEFSHCFGDVTSGFETFVGEDDIENNTAPFSYWKKLSSIRHISNVINNSSVDSSAPAQKDKVSSPLETKITKDKTFFYGDLVEYNPMEFKEKQLSKVMHRFNTAQRETINNENYSQYQYHEIISDDYDVDGFKITEYSAVNGIADPNRTQNDYATICRPEGYYYQPHYPVQIREYTRLQQGGNYTLRVKKAKPIQDNGILIQVQTTLSHGLSNNDIIFVCDEDTDKRYVTKCVQVINRNTFLMSPDYEEYILNATDFEDNEIVSNLDPKIAYATETKGNKNLNPYKKRFSWLELCGILNGDFDDDITYPTLTLRRKNNDIPDYASYIGNNQYIWRNLINIGDTNATELENFVFANGYFYIPSRINFYLKRQDPFNNCGLYYDGENGSYAHFPNDPSGSIEKEKNYNISKDTNDTSC